MPTTYSRPLPSLLFITKFSKIYNLKFCPYEANVYNSTYRFHFSFNSRQINAAKKFVRLCHLTLYRLRRFFLSSISNSIESYSFEPLIKLIAEISEDFSSNNFTQIPSHSIIINRQIGDFSGPLENYFDFLSFLNSLKARLQLVSQLETPEQIYEKTADTLKRIDIAFCMVLYFIYHFQTLSITIQEVEHHHNEFKQEYDSFIDYKHRLLRRINFTTNLF